MNGYLVFCALVGALGAFQFGWHSGDLNINETGMREGLELSQVACGVTQSIFCAGGLIGAYLASPLADRYGRKGWFYVASIIFIVAGVLQFMAGYTVRVGREHGMSNNAGYALLLAGRFLSGLGSGGSTVVVPMYLTEIASEDLQGAFGAVAQGGVVMGILISQLVSWPLTGSLDKQPWQWVFMGVIVLGVLQLFLTPLVSESPRWLVQQGREAEATDELRKLRKGSAAPTGAATGGDDGASQSLLGDSGAAAPAAGDAAQAEVASIRADMGQSGEAMSAWQVINSKEFRIPLLVCIALHLSQQLSGINGVFYYSSDFFRSAGLQNATVATLLASAVNAAAALSTIKLIEQQGRKTLLIVASAGMLVSAVALTIVLAAGGSGSSGTLGTAAGVFAVLFVLTYVTFFELGLGSIPWQIGGEFFPEGPRASAMGIAAGCNWVANGLVGQFFPVMNNALGAYTFLPFAGVLFLSLLLSIFIVPETKGRSVQQVLAYFEGFRRKKAAA